MASESKRFGSKSQEEIDAEIEENIPWNTKKSRESVWRQFSSFMFEQDYTIDGSTSPDHLNLVLKSWAGNMKRKDGSDDKEGVVKHMWNITAKLVQEMMSKKWNVHVNLFSDPIFKPARDARDATRRKLQACSEKRTSSAAALTEKEYLNMVQLLNEKVPGELQKNFFMIASYELAWRGGEGCNCFTYYFKRELDNKGFPTGRIEYNPIFSKMAQGCAKPLTDSKWLIENKENPNMCPVRLYDLLISIRGKNIKTERMFLTPSPFWNNVEGGVWYKNSPVGINEMSKWVKTLADKAGLDVKTRKISNHSIRSSAVSSLSKAEVGEQKLMKITRHQNLNSIKSYLQLDEEHHQAIVNKMQSKISSSTASTSGSNIKNIDVLSITSEENTTQGLPQNCSNISFTNCTFNIK